MLTVNIVWNAYLINSILCVRTNLKHILESFPEINYSQCNLHDYFYPWTFWHFVTSQIIIIDGFREDIRSISLIPSKRETHNSFTRDNGIMFFSGFVFSTFHTETYIFAHSFEHFTSTPMSVTSILLCCGFCISLILLGRHSNQP